MHNCENMKIMPTLTTLQFKGIGNITASRTSCKLSNHFPPRKPCLSRLVSCADSLVIKPKSLKSLHETFIVTKGTSTKSQENYDCTLNQNSGHLSVDIKSSPNKKGH